MGWRARPSLQERGPSEASPIAYFHTWGSQVLGALVVIVCFTLGTALAVLILGALLPTLAAVVVGVVLVAACLWFGARALAGTLRGGFYVTPEALVVRDLLGTRRVPWSDVDGFAFSEKLNAGAFIVASVRGRKVRSACLQPMFHESSYATKTMAALEYYRQQFTG